MIEEDKSEHYPQLTLESNNMTYIIAAICRVLSTLATAYPANHASIHIPSRQCVACSSTSKLAPAAFMITDSDSDLLIFALVSCSVYLRLCAMDFARVDCQDQYFVDIVDPHSAVRIRAQDCDSLDSPVNSAK